MTNPLAHRPRLTLVAIPIALVCSVLVLVLVLASVPERSADLTASGDILVSLDGSNWSTSLPSGLFSEAGTVVPGDSLSRTLWIENTSSTPATLRLSRIETAGTSSPLSHAISLTATSRDANGSPPFAAVGSCAQLLPEEVVGAGKSTSIVVTLAVADLRSAEAQGESAAISLLASMSSLGHAAASPCPESGTDVPILSAARSNAESDGSLVLSGAGLLYPAIMITSVLTGVALFAHLAARRRRHAE